MIRIKKGYAKDARIMARVLPRVLDDFFPAQDVMNKVIAEFISTLQPFPDLIAQVVHQVQILFLICFKFVVVSN